MYSTGTYRPVSGEDKGIWKIDGSFPGTQIAGGDNGLSDDDKLKFELRGSTLKLYQDTGAGFSEVLSVADTDITAAGESGMFWGNVTDTSTNDVNTGWDVDDFGSDEFAAAGGITPQIMRNNLGVDLMNGLIR